MGAISKFPDGFARFTNQTVDFMANASLLYGGKIHFFLTSGPMENTTFDATRAAVQQAAAAGLQATLIDMRSACVGAQPLQPPASIGKSPNADGCDGCAGHPGVEGHRGMFEAARPIIAQAMGWGAAA